MKSRASILILLGLLFKASSGENSTNIYYLELHIEEAAYENFTKLIENLVLGVDNSAIVKNITITTDCVRKDPSGMVNCTCKSSSSWSDEVCKNYTQCCNQDYCTFTTPNPRAMCLSKNRVLVNGSFTLNHKPFPQTAEYETFINNYTTMLERTYSTLGWFDSLSITGLRQGSVIVDFVMTLTEQFQVTQLQRITIDLQTNLTTTIVLIITGFTRISVSQKKVPYNSPASITCSTSQNLGNAIWSFTQDGQRIKDITNGTEAKVISYSQGSSVSISDATEVWKGTFSCEYKLNNSDFIKFSDSLYLDIALLPKIFIISDPQFPNCKDQKENKLKIEVQCIVPNTTEQYIVTWSKNFVDSYFPVPLQNGLISYKASYIISCDELEFYNVTCTFTNQLNQKRNATLDIPIIQRHSAVCKEDDGWPQTKANFTAIKFCSAADVGLQRRMCLKESWQGVRSECVNRKLSNLLEDAKNLERGLGTVEKADSLFLRLKQSTEQETMNTFANINASVDILDSIQNASKIQNRLLDMKVFPDFVKSSSNLLNSSANNNWRTEDLDGNYSLAFKYLVVVEEVIRQTNTTPVGAYASQFKEENVQIMIHNNSTSDKFSNDFGVSVDDISALYVQTAIKNLTSKLPNTLNGTETDPSDTILSVIAYNNTSMKIVMSFNKNRLRNHKMYCVFWANTTWSDKGCTWGGVDNPNHCECNHLSAFTILMAKKPIQLLYMDELTYTGLGFSVASLALCLVIEFLVWNAVVKSNIAHFKHTVLVNIMISLLIADCSFFVTHTPSSTPSNWCLTLTVMKHFCYLAVFFWMMCLSLGLLHQVIFVFVHLRKKVYLGLCFFLGYVCPLIIVVVTFISNDNGATGKYYSTETCWLIYDTPLEGSIHAFLFPVFIIVFVNMFTMVVVISRILKPTLSEGSTLGEKEVARSIVKTVVLLSPILGITWILGLFVLMLDLTKEPYAQIVNYAFTFFNSFQGFFILLTACFGEKKVLDALLKRLRPQKSADYNSKSSIRVTSTTKRK
ncbi:adhesion G protein-coupled receptor F5-like [Salminus brasiliensis]|uniref:adhesion G protein-coupled receptor F5-like n=1 Tax=Salminus brasiliensis TaxID=930266 RepID=UPI003B83A3EF